jgi:hypothetical protein
MKQEDIQMPCHAIAVAKGQVPFDLAHELDGLGTEAVAQACWRSCANASPTWASRN